MASQIRRLFVRDDKDVAAPVTTIMVIMIKLMTIRITDECLRFIVSMPHALVNR
jgi:hypothetical protein